MNATITAPPVGSPRFSCPSVEIVYSYRFEGELYTGIHEESFLSAEAMTTTSRDSGREKVLWCASNQATPKYQWCARVTKAPLPVRQFQREQLTS